MSTLSALLPDVLGRIEEDLPTANPPGPVFWDLTGEVYVAMVDAMFEAAMVTGVVQLNNVPVTLGPGTTYFAIQGNAGSGLGGFGNAGFGGGIVPQGIIAPLRLRAPWQIRKTTLKGLDDYDPTWSIQPPSSQITAWFPLGISAFGIYPQLAYESVVTMDFLYSPVNEYRPYTGNEPIPFQQEFTDLVSQYAAAMLRSKEGGAEAEEADVVFQDFMRNMKALSAFQTRVDSLVYSSSFGAGGTQPNPRKVV